MVTVAQFLTRLKTLIDNGKCDLRQAGISEDTIDGQMKTVTRWFIRIPSRLGTKIMVDKGEQNILTVWKDGQRLASIDKNVDPIIASIEASIEGYTSTKTTAELNDLYDAMGLLS